MRLRLLIATLLVPAKGLAADSAPLPDATQFEHDTGLQISQVRELQFGAGVRHYRMRTWRFQVRTEQLWPQLRRWQMHPLVEDAHDDGVLLLFDAALGSMAARRLPLKADWLDLAWSLLPPWPQRAAACYPDRGAEGGYVFRVAHIAAPALSADGWREVSFGATGELPQAPVRSGCAALPVDASFFMPMHVSVWSKLPYPFARRSFAEMVSDTLKPPRLHYHGTFFVDPSHFYRFALDARGFETLRREHGLQPVAEPDRALADLRESAARVRLDWWLQKDPAGGGVRQYLAICRRGNGFSMVVALWDSGTVWWYTSGEHGRDLHGPDCRAVP